MKAQPFPAGRNGHGARAPEPRAPGPQVSPRFARFLPALLSALLPVLLLGACASFEGIAPAVSQRSPAHYGAQATAVTWPRADWWTQFGDAQLDALVAQALAGNPQLETVQARLATAQAAVAGARAALGPRLDLQAQSTWQRYSEHAIYPPPLAGSQQFSNNVQVAAAWEFDFFGRHRAALRAALAGGRAAAAEAQAARVLVASSVVRSYLALAQRVQAQALLAQALEQRTQGRALVQARVERGLENASALRAAEAAIAELQRQREAVDEQAQLLRHALATLAGAGPEATRTLNPRLPEAAAPALPAALPAGLIGRRADLSAARWRVEAALAGVDAAKARFYPNVNLLAFAGLQSLGFAHWLDLGSRNLGVGPAISLPIFDAGALRAGLRGREAELDAAVAGYNSALGEAVRDVADPIASLQSLQKQTLAQQAAQAATQAALELAEQRFRAGLAPRDGVIARQLERLAQALAASELQARQMDATVALMRALGGGFDALADDAAATADPDPGPGPGLDSASR